MKYYYSTISACKTLANKELCSMFTPRFFQPNRYSKADQVTQIMSPEDIYIVLWI